MHARYLNGNNLGDTIAVEDGPKGVLSSITHSADIITGYTIGHGPDYTLGDTDVELHIGSWVGTVEPTREVEIID